MDLVVITPPQVEPVTLEEMQQHCRVSSAEESDYLEAIEKASRSYFEWRTGRTIYETVFEAIDNGFCGALKLPRASPLQSVAWVKYRDSTGTETTLDTSVYVVDTDRQPGFIVLAYGQSWPSFVPYPTGAVRVRYTAGINPSASPPVEVDEGIKHAIKLLAGALYEYREAEIVPDKPGIQAISTKYGLEALIAQYQIDFPN